MRRGMRGGTRPASWHDFGAPGLTVNDRSGLAVSRQRSSLQFLLPTLSLPNFVRAFRAILGGAVGAARADLGDAALRPSGDIDIAGTDNGDVGIAAGLQP